MCALPRPLQGLRAALESQLCSPGTWGVFSSFPSTHPPPSPPVYPPPPPPPPPQRAPIHAKAVCTRAARVHARACTCTRHVRARATAGTSTATRCQGEQPGWLTGAALSAPLCARALTLLHRYFCKKTETTVAEPRLCACHGYQVKTTLTERVKWRCWLRGLLSLRSGRAGSHSPARYPAFVAACTHASGMARSSVVVCYFCVLLLLPRARVCVLCAVCCVLCAVCVLCVVCCVCCVLLIPASVG